MKLKIFLCIVAFCMLNANVYSAVKTWDGGGADNNWQTAANWDNDTSPSPNDELIFPDGAAQTNINNNFGLFTTFTSLTIDGGNYVISGNPFRLTEGMIINGGTNAINTGVSLLESQTFMAEQGSTTTLAAVTLGGFDLEVAGNGSFGFGLITGTGDLTKTGLGASLVATAVGYSGAININDGILVVDANVPNSNVIVNATTTNGGFGISGLGGTGTVGSTQVISGGVSAGTLTSPTGILTINGNFDIQENGIVGVKIGGTTPGENGHDQFQVNGSVTLNNSVLAPIPFNMFQPDINDSFIIINNDGNDPVQGTFLNAPEGAVFGGALNTAFSISYQGGDGNDIVITRVNRANYDFDGDGKSDVSQFQPSAGTWNILQSSDSNQSTTQFGAGNDKIAPADYDGDAKTDFAVFRPSNGTWYVLNSADFSVGINQFGADGDIPVPNDFDGDGRADLGIFRPSDGIWYQFRSLGDQFFAQQFGSNGDVPLLGDYDGDGMGDLAIYRDGFWHLFRSADNSYVVVQLGISTDVPIPGDYDGDGMTDFAVFRGTDDSDQPDFYILHSGDLSFSGASWGTANDIPVVADYDGDGRTDIAVFREMTNDWFLLQSTNGFSSVNFGQVDDIPIPSAFNQ